MPDEEIEQIDDASYEDAPYEPEPEDEQYDDEPIEGESQTEEEEAPNITPTRIPAYTPPAGEDEDDAAIREGLGDDLYNRLLRKFNTRMQSTFQAQATAMQHVAIAAAEHPEFFRTYAPQIQATLSQLAPEVAARPDSVNIAVATILMHEAGASDLKTAAKKVLSLLAGEKQPAKTAAPPRTPIPTAQRSPQPTAAPQQRRPTTTREGAIKRIVDTWGVSPSEARRMLEEEQVIG